MTYATVAASNAQRVLAYGQSRGIELARSAALPARGAPPMSARIPAARMYELWSELARASGRPEFSLELAERSRVEDLQVLGYAVVTAPSVADALLTFTRYSGLLNDSGRYELVCEERTAQLRYFAPERPSLGVRLSRETAFAQILQGLNQLTGTRVDALAMSFRHEAPGRTRAHRAYFGCAVEFGASMDCLTFRRELLEAIPPSAHAQVWAYLCGQASTLLSELGPRPLLARVKDEVLRGLASGRLPEFGAVAASVGMSERSLRRALSAQGARYRDLIDALRRERAETLLAMTEPSITHVAFECGFADASAFTHACVRWFGRPPRAQREFARAGAALIMPARRARAHAPAAGGRSS
jgi:AraC-like DNA-binding protein